MKVIFTLSFLLIFPSFLFSQKSEDRILFSSSRMGNSDIFLMAPDGKILDQITDSPWEEWGPVWKSDTEISFLRQEKDQIKRIFLDLESKEEKEIAHPKACILDDKNIVFGPNANKASFVCKGDIYVQNFEANTVSNISEHLSGNANYVSWTHDPDIISFTSNHEGNNQIYFYNLRTKELKNITQGSSNDERGDVSADGKYLVFSSDRFEKGNQDIVLLDLKSKKLKRLTQSSGMELIARWATNSQGFYYGSNKDGNWEIYFFNLDSMSSKRLTNNAEFDGDPRIR